MIVNGWSTLATRHNGVQDKVYSAPNQSLGICCHSIEGTIAGALGRFDSTAKDAAGNYTPYAQASSMWLNPKQGLLIQCYPVTASTWTSGNRKANTELWAVESEGVAGEPLNANQVANMLTLRKEWEHYTARTLSRHGRTLWQHNEVWDWESPNAGSTSCPSGRYQPFFDALEGNDMAEIGDLILSVWGADGDPGTYEDRLAAASYRMKNAARLIDELGKPVAPLADRVAALDAKISPHLLVHPGGAPLASGTTFTVQVV